MSALGRLHAGLARRVPHGLKAAYHRVRRFLPGLNRSYELVCGKTLGRLRGDVLRRSGAEQPLATTNCGLLAAGAGFIGIYKEGTFNSCWELAIPLPHRPEAGVRQTLWLAEFNARCRLVANRRISVTSADVITPLSAAGIVEDARLARHGTR